MKKAILFVGALVLATAMSAQINVGANFLIGLPSGDWGDGVNTGFGGVIEGNYLINDDLSVGLEIGFASFGVEVGDGSISQIPITAKVEYFFLEDEFRPFVGLGLGYYAGNTKITIPFFGEQTASMGGFGITPRVGALYQVSDLVGLVLNIQYNLLLSQSVEGESIDSDARTNFIGIGIGARFTISD